MQGVLRIFQKKPRFFVALTIGYVVCVIVARWNIHIRWETAWFIAGSMIGTFLLEAAEEFFHLQPSPVRTIVFVVLLAALSFFIITSSGSVFASGIVLCIFLTLLCWQIGEWRIAGNLDRWYQMLADPVSVRTQKLLTACFIAIFLVETLLFIQGA